MTDASGLLDRLFGGHVIAAVLDDRARLQAMLDFEAALAKAEASAGVVPASAVAPIEAQCRAELFDRAGIAEAAAAAGNIAIPLIKRLTELVAGKDAEAARYVHWGATSQDAIDTGLILQLKAALVLLKGDLDRLIRALAELARRHRLTPEIGRTWLQHALPITFGLKAAGWLDAMMRHRRRISEIEPRLLVLQFGGAAGTLAALGDRGLAVADGLARELGLGLPPMPWHSHRDRVAELGAVLGLMLGSLGKIARDVSLLMQTEVGETFEAAGEGRGGSSTMPHKRNPVTCAVVLAAATEAPGLVATLLAAMPQDHERGLGGWHAEWTALPRLVALAAGALWQTANLVEGLEVDASRMRANIELTQGLVMAERVTMALGAKLGRLAAHRLVESACKRAIQERRHLKEVLAADAAIAAELKPSDLERLFEPASYIGMAPELIDRVIARSQGAKDG